MLLLDCDDLSTRQIAFDDNSLALLVINSNVQHALAESEYSLRRKQCDSAANRLGFGSLRELEADVLEASRNQLSEVEYLRARHVLSENHRTLQFVGRLSAQQWQEAGELLYASHASLRDDYAVSCPELDQLVELAKEIGLDGGVFGARMTGGGFGGSVIVLVEKEAVISVATRILELFNQSRSTNQHHATALTTRPSRGAHVI